jgi:cobalt-precorrin-5B (C1)-methyltransferase
MNSAQLAASAPLRTGYTTGACAAAAAKAAALMLSHQVPIQEVTITLPAGIPATFRISGQIFDSNSASCFVIKDAGDDPDVTNGAELHVTVCRVPDSSCSINSIAIEGGLGIGRVTKPGLAVAPGEWAINPVPRGMILDAVTCTVPNQSIKVTVSIPDGAERAQKTLNSRLGIIGGLSILGTTGIVRPISAQAWTDTIDAALDVAKACKCENVVISTGRSSELAVQKKLILPEEAYVMMGDHVAHSLKACAGCGFMHPVVACQFAKLLKIACGHANTHAAASELDLAQLLEWARSASLPENLVETISKANTAREIALACSFDSKLLDILIQQAGTAARRHAPDICPRFVIADYSGNCILL